MSKVYISIDQREIDGALQLSIGIEGKHGYRIAGPKYDGNGKVLVKKFIDKEVKKEIMAYLKRV